MKKWIYGIIGSVLAAGMIGVFAYISGGAVLAYSNEDRLGVIEDAQKTASEERTDIKNVVGEMKGDVKYILKILERMEKRNGP